VRCRPLLGGVIGLKHKPKDEGRRTLALEITVR
jgi:hypothetical protein